MKRATLPCRMLLLALAAFAASAAAQIGGMRPVGMAITAQAGAYAANELVRPASVIVTHVNEGATTGGKVRPAAHTAAFTGMVKGRPVYPALSGRTMEFDGDGKCVAECS